MDVQLFFDHVLKIPSIELVCSFAKNLLASIFVYVTISEFSVEFYWPKCLFLYHDHTLFDYWSLQKVLIVGRAILLSFILPFQN